MSTQIIQSLLDTDLYKFTMLQVILHQFPQTYSVYKFRCRNLDELQYPLSEIKGELEKEVDILCDLKFKVDELNYLRSLRFIKSDFVDYLELFQLKRRFINISLDEKGRLDITIEGPMIQAMFFEIFILSIISELYFKRLSNKKLVSEGERRLQEKSELLKKYSKLQKKDDFPFLVADFGTRRRANFEWQKHVIKVLNSTSADIFRGTSNVYLAYKLGITPIGTMAHEYMQAFQAFNVKLRDFQKASLEAWVSEYRGDLGVALTDVINMDAFLKDFDLYFAKLFEGLRHDSGNPYKWGEKAYNHYNKMKIDSKTKMLLFSNELTLQKAWDLYQYFKDKFKTSFGIGTNFTNDFGIVPLNIVLKLIKCNGQSVAKISDSPGKTMTDNYTFLKYLKQVFSVK